MKTLKEIKTEFDNRTVSDVLPVNECLSALFNHLIAKEESEKQDLKDVQDSVSQIIKALRDRISDTESKTDTPRLIAFQGLDLQMIFVDVRDVRRLIEGTPYYLQTVKGEYYHVRKEDIEKVQAALRAFTVSETESKKHICLTWQEYETRFHKDATQCETCGDAAKFAYMRELANIESEAKDNDKSRC